MKLKKIRKLEYRFGDELNIIPILYNSQEPILLKIKDFTTQFSLDYFIENINAKTNYCLFENGQFKSHHVGADFAAVLQEIKKNKSLKIFAEFFTPGEAQKIERNIPLWQTIPFRPRFFKYEAKSSYYFGGPDTHTPMHFDREHCCNLHICFCGKKKMLLFTEDQSDFLYKTPYIGETPIDFAKSWDEIYQQYPKMLKAQGYEVTLEKGDMIFLPKNCWHFTTYLESSAAASYVFYPKKIFQFYGTVTGYFYIGYRLMNLGVQRWTLLKKFERAYAYSSGMKKKIYKLIEACSYCALLPSVSLLGFIKYKLTKHRLY